MNERFKEQIRHYIRIFIFPVLLVSVVVLAYLPAMKSPSPHEVPVAIAGPEDAVAPLVAALQGGVGDQFTVLALPDAEAARAAIERQDVSAALVLGATPEDRAAGIDYRNAAIVPDTMIEQSAILYVATAGSPALATAGMAPLQNVAAQMGMPVMVRDLVPLDGNDLAGNGQMWFTLAVTLSAYVGVTMLSTVAKDLLNLRTLLRALPVYGLVMGVIASLLLRLVFDSFGANMPLLIATAILNVTAVGLGAACICRLAGGLSTLVVMFVFVGLGMTSSGAAIPVQFVPAFYRFFNPIMPYGATSRAVRNIVYFDNANLWQNWAVLGAWIVAAALGLWLIERWRPAPDGKPVEVGTYGSESTLTPVAA